MDPLLRHALLTGTAERVLRYLVRPVCQDGQPHPLSSPEVLTRVQTWQDGARIRHWADGNNVNLYNEQNVLRVEMTLIRAQTASQCFVTRRGAKTPQNSGYHCAKGLRFHYVRK